MPGFDVQVQNAPIPFDPFAQVFCTVCNRVTDESLLLLCDLCDSAAHTYCVGLGLTIPEGDWFCHDCTVSRAEYANNEINTEDENQNEMPSHSQNGFPFAERLPTRVSSDSNRYVPYSAPIRITSAMHEVSGPSSSFDERLPTRVSSDSNSYIPSAVPKLVTSAMNEAAGRGTRTLDRCRNVHSHIRALRENWNALRNGSLSFSSCSFKPGCKSQKHYMHEITVQAKSLSSASCQLSQNQDKFGSLDIDKAWKKLAIAKSKQFGHKMIRSVQSTQLSSSKASGLEERSKSNITGTRNLGITGIEKSVKDCFLETKHGLDKCSYLGSKRLNRVMNKEAAGCSQSFPTANSPGLFESSSSIGNENRSRLLQENVHQALSFTMNESAFSVRQGTFQSSDAKADHITSSADKIVTSKVNNIILGNDSAESKVTKYDESKSEIQSLVKLNLKHLSRDKNIGTIIILNLVLCYICFAYSIKVTVSDCLWFKNNCLIFDDFTILSLLCKESL